jgi:hypothetical protein
MRKSTRSFSRETSLTELTGLSEEEIWKSLLKFEQMGLITIARDEYGNVKRRYGGILIKFTEKWNDPEAWFQDT